MCKGFIRLPRRLFETRWWNTKRVYTEPDAILDIYQSANARDRTEPDGTRILRNQFATSQRTLGERWIWPPMKVNRFLKRLEEEGWLTVTTCKARTIITILDFGIDTMQSDTPSDTPSDTQGDTPTDTPKPLYTKGLRGVGDTPSDTHTGTQGDTQVIHIYNNKEYKEENIESVSPTMPDLFPDGVDDPYSFDKFWNLYDKKVGRNKSLGLYLPLSQSDRRAIFEYLPHYKKAQPDKQYRKNPETFLRNRSWEDELVADCPVRRGTASAIAQIDNSPNKKWSL